MNAKRRGAHVLCIAIALLFAVSVFTSACSDSIDDNTGSDTGYSDTSNDTAPSDEDPTEPIEPDPVDDNNDVEQPDPPIDDPNTDPDPPDEDTTDPDTPEEPSNPDPPETPDPVQLRIDSIAPPTGPLSGQTPFTIEGAGFSAQTVVFFDSRRAETNLVDGRLIGQTPEGPSTGPVSIKVLDPQSGEDVLIAGFTYTATVGVDTVVPARIPTEGGIEVTVSGRGFTPETRVSFGGATATRHTFVNETVMRVIAPMRAAGIVDVRASNPSGTALLRSGVTYFETLNIKQIRPASGHVSGGDTVELMGSGFQSDMIVEFGAVQATVVSVASDGLKANVTVPPGTEGLTYVRVESPDGDAFLLSDAFYYFDDNSAFNLAAVTPNTGPKSGGTEVTLIGSGLDDPQLVIKVGGIEVTILENESGHAVIQIPAHAVGAVNISAENGNGESVTLSGAFSFVDDLWVDGLSPDTSDVLGQTSVIIEGEGFSGAQRVTFGGLAANFTVDSDTQITAVAPAHAAGTVDVAVHRDGLTATFYNSFTYTEDIEIWGFSPSRGSIAGNTYLEIRGKGFAGQPQVSFGGVAGVDVQVLDSQTLAVRTPPHPTQAVEIEVTQGGQSVVAPSLYTFYNPGSQFGGSWGGPVQGAVNVSVFSQYGGPIEGAFVMLSTNAASPYQGITNDQGLVTLSGPHVYGDQTITAVAAEHSSATVQRVDAENITIFLTPASPPDMGPMPPGPPTATFKGNVTGLDKIAEPGPGEFRMAMVLTTQRDPWRENPNPGDGNVVMANGPYTLVSRVGDVAVIAVGGLYNNSTGEFKPLRMAVERYLFAADGQTYTVNLDLDIPLDQPGGQVLTFKLNHAPRGQNGAGPHLNRVVPYLDFGFEGVFGGIDFAEGSGDVLQAKHQARLTGKLADVSYLIIGGAYSNTGAPLSEAFKRNVTDLDTTIELPNLPGIPSVTSQLTPVVDGLVSFDTNSVVVPSFYYVLIRDFMGATVWEAFFPGHISGFRFPDFPDFSHLPPEDRPAPYPGGAYSMMIVSISMPNFSYTNFSYSDLDMGKWDAYSLMGTVVSF